MANVPGSAGLPLVGDRSYDFYKDPIKFQYKHMEYTKSRVFLSRLLNKPTIFIGSNSVLQEVLKDHAQDMEFGYKQFMWDIYGDNILFSDGDYADGLREALKHLFTPEAVKSYQSRIDRIVKKSLEDLDHRSTICAYKFFKKLAVELCLSLFLGLDFSEEEAEVISQLTTTHWHGIISVPVAIKLPKMSETTYSKALHAKAKLLNIIEKRREEKCHCFVQKVESLPKLDEVLVNNHLLLFTSALVPKAISSVLTSFVIEMGNKEKTGLQTSMLEDNDMLESVVLEILRLYPPFVGGRRVITQDFTAGGYKMPAGHAVLYLTYLAQRDPTVFDNPDDFRPDRWHNQNKEDQDKLFCFGQGPRNCLGQTLVWSIVKTVIKELMSRYKFNLEPGQDFDHKWLPVSRPKGSVLVSFETRQASGDIE